MTETPAIATETPELGLETAETAAEIKAKVPDAVDIVFSRDGAEVARVKTGNNALAMYTELAEDSADGLCDDLKSCDIEIVSAKVKDGALRGTREDVVKALADDILSPTDLADEIKGFVDTVMYRTPARMVSVLVHFGDQNPSPIYSRMSGSVPVSVDDCKGFVKAVDCMRHDFVERMRKSGVEVDDDKNLIVPATTMPKAKL